MKNNGKQITPKQAKNVPVIWPIVRVELASMITVNGQTITMAGEITYHAVKDRDALGEILRKFIADYYAHVEARLAINGNPVPLK